MKKAYLVLQNGQVFQGFRFGAEGESLGELVFTTGMGGYLETLTDPSYYGQIVVQTFPLMGNYGVIPADFEGVPRLRAYVVREWCPAPSNFRCEGDLDSFLKERNIPGLWGVDTRLITRILRDEGVMNALLCDRVPEDLAAIASYRVTDALTAVSCGDKQVFLGKGILVGEGMETSLPGVWAAGDCTESMDVSAGTPGLLAVLPNASLQGFCAGANMAGGSEKFDKGIKMNSIGFFGLHIMSAGTYTEPVYTELTDTGCKKLFAKDGVLTGFILLGDTAKAGIYTSLIRDRTPLESIDFEAVKKEPSLVPFGRDYRAKKLGGAV